MICHRAAALQHYTHSKLSRRAVFSQRLIRSQWSLNSIRLRQEWKYLFLFKQLTDGFWSFQLTFWRKIYIIPRHIFTVVVPPSSDWNYPCLCSTVKSVAPENMNMQQTRTAGVILELSFSYWVSENNRHPHNEHKSSAVTPCSLSFIFICRAAHLKGIKVRKHLLCRRQNKN